MDPEIFDWLDQLAKEVVPDSDGICSRCGGVGCIACDARLIIDTQARVADAWDKRKGSAR